MRMLTPYWSTRSLASDLFDDLDRLFTAPERSIYDERAFNPPCEISETDDHILMSVDLPGLKREDIKIELNGRHLTVSGERKRETTSKAGEKVQRYEKSYGFFKRSFMLPETVDAENVEARFENGVLEVALPKTQAAKPRQVEIQTGKTGGIFSKLLPKESNPDKAS